MAEGRDEGLAPESPKQAGVEPRPSRIEDVEPERMLENEVRARLEADGFTDDQILRWVEAFVAENGEGEPDDVIAWIRAKEQQAGDA